MAIARALNKQSEILLCDEPTGALSAFVLFKICSSPMQTYPFIFDVQSVLFAFGFIFITIVLSHVIAMLSIKRWNLADNTRTRE